VEYAAAAPGFFGLDQVNVVLPAALDGAGIVSLTVTTDSNASNTVSAQINLLPAAQLGLSSIALSPSIINGGDPMTATITLNGVARAGGFPIALRSTNPAARPQAVVTIAEGQATVQAPVATNSVITVQTGSIQASAGGTTVSTDFELDPVNQVQVTGFSVTPNSILGGRALSGEVDVTGTVPIGGVTIQLTSDSSSVRPPDTIGIPFNKNSVTFPIATTPVTGTVNANLTATLGRSSASATVKLVPPLVFTVDNTSVVGGTNINGTVTIGEPAPAGGATVTLSSSDRSLVSPPFSVTVPATNTSATFAATTTAVTASRTATLTATYQTFTQSVSVSTTPPPTAILDSVAVSPSTVNGGTSTQGVVTLTTTAGFGGVRIDLQSSLPIAAQAPAFVSIPQGFTTAQFTINTTRVLTPQAVTITARQGNIMKTALLTVQ
jgi:hypothetical protein